MTTMKFHVHFKEREHSNAIKFVYTRDKRASRKAEMGGI